MAYEIGTASGLVQLDADTQFFTIPEDTAYTLTLFDTNNFINWTINGVNAGSTNPLTSTVGANLIISANYSS